MSKGARTTGGRRPAVAGAAFVVAAGLIAVHNLHHDNYPNQILNVSYDPTR